MKTPKTKATATEESKISDSAKKLIQARLPFKVVTTPTTSQEEKKENSIITAEVKKRKLSAKDYDEVECLISDEDTEKTDTNNQKRLKLQVNKVAQLLNADEEFIADNDDIEEEEAEETTKTKSAPLKIKLPTSGKKAKRRKSKKSLPNEDTAQSSDDLDKVNPKKRAKVESKTCEIVELISDESDHDGKVAETKEEEKENNKIVINKEKLEKNEIKNKTSEKENLKEIEVKNTQSTDVEEIELVSDDSDSSSRSSTENTEAQKTNSPTTERKKSTKDNTKVAKLTEKQLRLKEQRRLAREEKERKLMQDKLQKQRDKEQREETKKREREEKEEQKRKEREDKENKKREEREEKERKRLAEIEAKTEEKRKRHEAKEEELRKKDEERKRKDLEKQEAQLKAKKAAEAFTKFFVAKNETSSTQNKDECDLEKENAPKTQTLAFRPFQIKGSMKLAPVSRRQLTAEDRTEIDKLFSSVATIEHKDKLYLQQLRTGQHMPVICRKVTTGAQKETNSEFGDDEDVQVIGK